MRRMCGQRVELLHNRRKSRVPSGASDCFSIEGGGTRAVEQNVAQGVRLGIGELDFRDLLEIALKQSGVIE